MEETFLLLFRFDNPLESSVEFMKVDLPISNLSYVFQKSDSFFPCLALAPVRLRRLGLHRGRRAQELPARPPEGGQEEPGRDRGPTHPIHRYHGNGKKKEFARCCKSIT